MAEVNAARYLHVIEDGRKRKGRNVHWTEDVTQIGTATSLGEATHPVQIDKKVNK